MDGLLAKRTVLEETLAGYGAVVVAFSGGVDSAFLTAVAHEVLGRAALAVTAVSPSLARREREGAERLAQSYGWNHRVVETHEVDRPEYARNDPDRCYWCKQELFDLAERKSRRWAPGSRLAVRKPAKKAPPPASPQLTE
jgi:uncharacterized protein